MLIDAHPEIYPHLSGLTVDQYNDCIKHFLDHEVNAIIHNLSSDEKDQFFRMITEFPDLLDTLFFLKGAPFTNYVIYGNEFYDALKDPHPGIDFTPSWIVTEYKEWLTNTGRPLPTDRAVQEGLDLTPMIEFQTALTTPNE